MIVFVKRIIFNLLITTVVVCSSFDVDMTLNLYTAIFYIGEWLATDERDQDGIPLSFWLTICTNTWPAKLIDDINKQEYHTPIVTVQIALLSLNNCQ